MITIDLFGQFPDISLRLDDFYIADPTDEKGLDTLMYFSTVYAQFKLLPALRGKTILQRITAKGGKVYLHWDSNGDGNSDGNGNDGNGNRNGDGVGDGKGIGNDNSDSVGNRNGNCNGNGEGHGEGSGNGDGEGNGDGNGEGNQQQ